MIANWMLAPAGVASPLTFVLLGTFSVMLMGIAKAGFGGAIGLLAMPMLIAACGNDAKLATGILLPLLIACDQVAIVKWWGRWDFGAVKLLLGGAVLGIAAGGVALAYLNRIESAGSRGRDLSNAVLMFIVGAVALAFVALQAMRSLRSKPLTFRPVLWQGTCFGAAAGVASTLTHGAGPITAMYLLPQGMSKESYVASTTLFFWIGNLLKVPVYLALGRIDAGAAGGCVLLLPGMVVGALLGVVLHRRLGKKQFGVIVYSMLTLAGAHLVLKALGVL